MGYLQEINDFVRQTAGKALPNDRLPKSSFAKNALDGTLYFSGLFSEGISIDFTSTISRTIERAYASFVQTVISMNSTIDISSDKNASSFLKKFHKNVISFEATEDYTDEPFLGALEQGKVSFSSSYKGNYAILFEEADDPSLSIKNTFRYGLEESMQGIVTEPLYTIEASDDVEGINQDDLMQRYIDERDTERHNAIEKRQTEIMLGSKEPRVPKVLNERDAKKLNDFTPYNMAVRLMGVNERNEFVQYIDFVIGVKTTVHVMNSEELISNLVRIIENNGVVFNFLKWTTGEKSFIKDLLLNISDIKLDIANQAAGSSPWWLTLKRMKENSTRQKAMLAKNQFIPNATLVITSIEADYIKTHHGYDLNDEKIAKKIMNGLFLMTFIIVDDATKTIKLLYDGYPTYQYYSLELLEKEVNTNSNKLGRELSRMISRN